MFLQMVNINITFRKLSMSDEPDMQDTAGEARASS